jgi:hypothetical protein
MKRHVGASVVDRSSIVVRCYYFNCREDENLTDRMLAVLRWRRRAAHGRNEQPSAGIFRLPKLEGRQHRQPANLQGCQQQAASPSAA